MLRRHYFVWLALLGAAIATIGFVPEYLKFAAGTFPIAWVLNVHSALMVAWLCRVLRSDTVTMGGVEQATPAQLTVMMLSLPALSRVLSSRTGLGKNHGLGVVFFMEVSGLRR